MSATVTPPALTRELLGWVADGPRSYDDVVEAWVSNCPRHPVWDEARAAGLVAVVAGRVELTSRGRAALQEETS